MSAGSQPLLCFLIDAFRHDYLDPRETPFLAELGSVGTARPLRTILGYSDSIRATVFTGAYPDELGYWMEYRFRPDADPFRPFSSLGAMDRFPSDLALRALKLGASRTVMPRLARSRGYESLDLRHIPFGAMRFFDYTLRRPMTSYGSLAMPTIFDRLTDAGRSWSYLDSSKVGDRGISDGLGAADPDTALIFVYLHHVDMASHLHGIDSPRFHSVLRQTDDRIRRITSSVRRRFGDVDVLLFSDHGMSRARAFRSLPELRRHPGFGRSFCFALDATMVRLWYLDDRDLVRTELRAIVSSKLPGKFLEREDRRALHLDFSGRDYGDDVFLVDPGVIVFPNFHSYLRPKAMHAYHPGDPDQRGILVVSHGALDLGEEAGLLDVHGLINRMAGLAEPTQVAV